ncbi:hypothetical protein CEP66_12495 [Citrobacter koseri]|nr:hypothetical protein CEP66_12495 [Citrobacter koseri]ATF98792.1 hypothetical protein CO700_17950 [Citrobacter koseri]AVE58458.1 hypothetical protein AM352_08740 [Citrobacter koseri]AVE70047.1 hypothetical protein AM351_20660 [Citrobacter koseri]PNN12754.1 hypothetical protein AL526_008545 [Citrobacter koseri]
MRKRLPYNTNSNLSAVILISRDNPPKTLFFIAKPPYIAPRSFRAYVVNGSLRARKFALTFF